MSLSKWLNYAAAGAVAYSAYEMYQHLSEKDLTGEIVVITGGASGIGKLMAMKLAKCGCRVIVWDLNKDSLDEVVKEIRSFGGEAEGFVVDVTKREKVYAVSQQIQDTIGNVDILINNAGIVSGKKILECNDDLMEKTVQVNTISHFWTIKAFLPSMLERNHGHIVTIASMAGISGCAGLVDYCASKFGAVGTADSLRMELKSLGKSGVKTTLVCPYYISTGMFEGAKSRFDFLLPILTPQYVADSIITAIKRDTQMILLPNINNIVPFLKGCMSVNLGDSMADFLGVNNAMDGFVQTRKN